MAIILHFVTVNSFVVNHILLLCKTFTTGVTDPWFLSCMNSSVQLQLAFTYKPGENEYTINDYNILLVLVLVYLLSQNSQTQGLSPMGCDCLLWVVTLDCMGKLFPHMSHM